jgi:hypothetical protein
VSDDRQTRRYSLNGVNLRISCSEAVAEALDSRFRLLPRGKASGPTISIDFQSLPDGEQHNIEKPLGQGRAFYKLNSGEAIYFASSDQLYLSYGDGVRMLAQLSESHAYFSIVESDPVDIFIASHLFLTISLVELLKRHGLYSMHAAGFSKNENVILIPGKSGAGKSTLAITLLRGGFGYLSDDMVFLQRRSGELRVLGFPEDVDVSDGTINFFPELDFLRHTPKAAGSPKKHVRPDEIYGVELIGEARPRAIVFPRICASETSSLRSIDADEAFLELVPNVLLTEGRSCQNHLNILTELARQTPCYRLETGRDFDRLPSLLDELLIDSPEAIHA